VDGILAQARQLRIEQARRGEAGSGGVKAALGRAAAAAAAGAGRGRAAAKPAAAAAPAGVSATVAPPPAAPAAPPAAAAPLAPPPLALPEAIHAAAARLSAAGVVPGTTLSHFLDATLPPAPAGGAAFAQRLVATLGGAVEAVPPAGAALPASVASRAAADALSWELRALAGPPGVDWAAAQDERATPQALCTAAHTLGHVLRRACMCMRGSAVCALR
jgi:hypothetical protein